METIGKIFMNTALLGFQVKQALFPMDPLHPLEDYPQEWRDAIAERAKQITTRDRALFSMLRLVMPRVTQSKPVVELAKSQRQNRRASPFDLVLPDVTVDKLTHLFVKHDEQFKRLYIHIHGGGFVLGVPSLVYSEKAKENKANYFSLDMRLLPGCTLDDSIDDCLACYRYAIDVLKYEPKNIVLVGESAGGCFIVNMIQRLRQAQVQGQQESQMPGCIILHSPSLDLTASSDSQRRNVDSDVLLVPTLRPQFNAEIRKAHPNDEDLRRLSGLFMPKEGFPPTFISVSADEKCVDECCQFAKDLQTQANVDVEIDCTSTLTVHTFAVFFEYSDVAQQVVDKAQHFVLKHLPEVQV